MKHKIVSTLLALSIAVTLTACGGQGNSTNTNTKTEAVQSGEAENAGFEGATVISLSEEEITVNGAAVTTNSSDAVYVANDIIYYEAGKDFTYGEGTKEDAHSKEEADAHTVVHITEPGTYVVSGKLSAGQIAVDLGEKAEDDPDAVVTLVLNNADITCSVAPGVIFYNVYECSSSEEENATKDVDTSAAGANVVIADGSVNTITGSYVAKIYKSVELNEAGTEVVDSKKLHKYDGAFYSKMSMNINGGKTGDGVLNIHAENEGLDTELHLTINGGNISIVSGNDGINTNEDNVSVTTVNGGVVTIKVDGSTGEGDGIDSNGWLVINGGAVNAVACSDSMDAGIDSDMGIHINGGTVIAAGNMLDRISESAQNYVVFTFGEQVKAGSEIALKKGEENLFFNLPNDYSYLILSTDKVEEGTYTLWKDGQQLSVVEMNDSFGGMGMMFGGKMPEGFEPGKMPEGFEPGKMPEGFEPGQMPEGFEPGKMPEGFEPDDFEPDDFDPDDFDPDDFEPDDFDPDDFETDDFDPDDFDPDDFDGRERPEGFEPGKIPEGFEPGKMPEGFEGKERPEGMERGERPQGGRGGNFRGGMNAEDAVTEFEIKAGGNMYYVM